jgi:hypothetical protein
MEYDKLFTINFFFFGIWTSHFSNKCYLCLTTSDEKNKKPKHRAEDKVMLMQDSKNVKE